MDLFAGTRGSGIFLSTDAGATWTSLHNGIPTITNVNAICFNGEDLYAATDYVLYFSTDEGATWNPTGLNTSLISSNTFISSVTVSPRGTGVLVGTNDHGVLASRDGGATWNPVNEGLTDMCIYSLRIVGSFLYAGTNETGVWRLPLSDLTSIENSTEPVPTSFALVQNYPNPFNPSTIIRYQLPVSRDVTLKVYDILGKEVATLVNGRENPGNYTVRFNGSRFASGVYFYEIKAGQYRAVKKMLLLK